MDMDDVPDELVITLRKPVSDGHETVETITLREPTSGEMEQAMNMGNVMASNIKLVSLISGVKKHLVAKIGYRDMNKAAAYLGRFTNADPKDGN